MTIIFSTTGLLAVLTLLCAVFLGGMIYWWRRYRDIELWLLCEMSQGGLTPAALHQAAADSVPR